ncbi:hypothetical protein N7517_007524 [Penicillium concentricum]|uniref:Uncharacterized protein n=1 Tax=Penicillium concentricum TaxID=293559 RepID=A0A9W9VB15_9EURO|nr:uncharacterized protein N7517_007524 [Penicillium concentricum]KAJ5375518.1 hypothetical protein N7517_007524 [Penicillium concentricum]
MATTVVVAAPTQSGGLSRDFACARWGHISSRLRGRQSKARLRPLPVRDYPNADSP